MPGCTMIDQAGDGDLNLACIRGTITRPAFGEHGAANQTASAAFLTVETIQRWWKDGEPRQASEFHKVVIFDPPSKEAAQACRAGDRVYLEGDLQTRKRTEGMPPREVHRTHIVLNPGRCRFIRLTTSNQENTDATQTDPAAQE